MKIILLTMTFHFSLFLSAQEIIIAKMRQQNTAYLEVDNPLNVLVEGYRCSSIIITSDNGKIEKIGCYYIYHPSRLEETNFTIFKRQNGKTVKLKKYTWYVIPLPKPVAMVGGVPNGSEISKGQFSAQPGIASYAGGNMGD